MNDENEEALAQEVAVVEQLMPVMIEEIKRARRKHRRDFSSHHEAYAVIKEEFEEWWDSVKANRPDSAELMSVAAMAMLAIAELGPLPQDANWDSLIAQHNLI